MKTYVYLWSYLATFLLERELFRAKFVERVKTHFYLQQLPPPPPQKLSVFKKNEKKFGPDKHTTKRKKKGQGLSPGGK